MSCVVYSSAPFMHCVHHYSADGFCTLVLFIIVAFESRLSHEEKQSGEQSQILGLALHAFATV